MHKDKYFKHRVCQLIRKMAVKQCDQCGEIQGVKAEEHATLTEKGWQKPSECSITGAEFQKLNRHSLHKEVQSIPIRSHKDIKGKNTQHLEEVTGIRATDHDAPERVDEGGQICDLNIQKAQRYFHSKTC